MPTNDEHTPRPGPPPIPRADTDEIVGDVLAAGKDLGAAGEDPEAVFRKTLSTLVQEVRNGNGNGPPPKGLKHPLTLSLLKYVVTSLIALGAAYGGIKLAVKSNADDIQTVDSKVETHKAKTAHPGAATKVEVKAVEDKVQHLDKSVGELGVQIGEQEKRQAERHDDIKDELKYLRRRRRPD